MLVKIIVMVGPFPLLKGGGGTFQKLSHFSVANKKILLGRSFIYLVASLNAAHHGWAAK